MARVCQKLCHLGHVGYGTPRWPTGPIFHVQWDNGKFAPFALHCKQTSCKSLDVAPPENENLKPTSEPPGCGNAPPQPAASSHPMIARFLPAEGKN